MNKKKLIILVLSLVLLFCAILGVTLYFTLRNNETTGPSKVDLGTIITTTEINGNEANEEEAVLNKIIELHSEGGINEENIQIKEDSFIPAEQEQPGQAIIEAQEISEFTGEVDITITPLSEKINLGKQTLEYLAKVNYMDNIINEEANTIKSELHTNIDDKMTNLNLEENIDYQISNNLDELKEGDDLNNFAHHIIISSLESSEKATGSFTLTIKVQENINQRSIDTIKINPEEVEGLNAVTAKNITNNIQIKVQAALTTGQINEINVDYEIINLDLIKEGAKFTDYSDKLIVKGISLHLNGEFAINFAINQESNVSFKN